MDYKLPTGEPIEVVYVAATWTEAIVVRGLLQSAGIPSPALGDGNPAPGADFLPTAKGIEIYALESQAQQARKVIEEYIDESPMLLDEDGGYSTEDL